jgi:NAD(P)-dependent dehydrogenase (short-subunit alcohol dehydrogenase family)
VLVTGAGSGIGRAVARHFAARGWRVGAYDVDAAAVRALAAELAAVHGPGRVAAGRLDVTDPVGWEAAVAESTAPDGRLDVLVNNAGVLASGPLAELTAAAQRRVLDVNAAGVLLGCRAAFAALRRSPRGCAVNLGSMSCVYGQPRLAAYSASKAAVRALTEALDLEWRPAGVRCVDVWPGFVRTRMLDGMRAGQPGEVPALTRLGARLEPDQVARVVWAAATDGGRRSRVHWPVGADDRALAVLAGAAPRLARAVTGWLARG